MKFTSTIFGAASGSIGGTTFSRNRFGMYTRIRAIPTNPNSLRQQLVRSRFSFLSKAWGNNLSQAQRNAWNLYASQVTVKDRLGQDINLTGQQMFIRSNSIVVSIPLPIVEDAPTNFTLAETDATLSASISEATQLVSVVFDDTQPWASEDDAGMQISISRPVSPGVSFIPPIFRVAGTLLGDLGVPLTSPQDVTSPFNITAGQKVLVQARIVRADGRLSEPFRITVTAAA